MKALALSSQSFITKGMTESKETKKYQPSPAKDQASPTKGKDQTDGANQDLAGTGKSSPKIDVIQEQKRTEQGYSESSKPKTK